MPPSDDSGDDTTMEKRGISMPTWLRERIDERARERSAQTGEHVGRSDIARQAIAVGLPIVATLHDSDAPAMHLRELSVLGNRAATLTVREMESGETPQPGADLGDE